MSKNDKTSLVNRIKDSRQQPYNRGRISIFAPWASIGTDETIRHKYIDNKITYITQGGERYKNHIELAGRKTSAIISYGMTRNNALKLRLHVVYPSLRYNPNVTQSSLDNNFKGVAILVNDSKAIERVARYEFDGILAIHTTCLEAKICREFISGNLSKALVERITITNTSTKPINIAIQPLSKDVITSRYAMAYGEEIAIKTIIDSRSVSIQPLASSIINVAYVAEVASKPITIDYDAEYVAREQFLDTIANTLSITTDSDVINTMTHFAKIRASESIFDTKGGLMHSPGGGSYYAALWTNDQCEYVNPLFGYLGYELGVEQSINCYNHYKKYISDKYALVTSIIAEGEDVWHGAKDRGDSAMYAYGCAKFLLARGDKALASSYMPYINQCLQFVISQINADGVVTSDSDELENRYESGNANLCTSCLAYDALVSASYLSHNLGDFDNAVRYETIAKELAVNINKYFSATVEGYDTYRYCKEESKLRSWICMPLCVGINDRAAATVEALLSNKLRKGNGLLSRSGGRTFWDRSLLYALRGLFLSGYSQKATELMESYSRTRLFGSHIPYPVEAFPEGNQAQLSAESGLYVRILTEGIAGLNFVGLGEYTLTPHLPTKWTNMTINNINIGSKLINITIRRANDDDDYDIKCTYQDGSPVTNVNGTWSVTTTTMA